MKVKIKFESIAFVLIIVFSIIGLIVFQITIHELSHYQDFHRYIATDEICVLNIPTTFNGILVGSAGWYGYTYNRTNLTVRDSVSDIDVYTEAKAYTISFVITALFTVLIIIVIKRRIENNIKAELYDEAQEIQEVKSLSG